MAKWSERIPLYTTLGAVTLFAASLGWVSGRLPTAAAVGPTVPGLVADLTAADQTVADGTVIGAEGGQDTRAGSTVELRWLYVGDEADGYWLGVPMVVGQDLSRVAPVAPAAQVQTGKRVKTRGS